MIGGRGLSRLRAATPATLESFAYGVMTRHLGVPLPALLTMLRWYAPWSEARAWHQCLGIRGTSYHSGCHRHSRGYR